MSYVCSVENEITVLKSDGGVSVTITTLLLSQEVNYRMTMSPPNRNERETYMDVLSILMSHRMAKRLNIFNMKKNILFWATITIVIVAIHLLTPNCYR